ncbi:hypothetical protein NDK50_22605 [Paraburkholderia bryophila]|uniref:hypothetical protein n=1 Tax=Paraburkholderia bryophila TaxID=420952 RepID=UPI002349065F|nr:hypothetical protein [Paraburkholderia bryophila]WCM23649.1 hypothetical protein NDK50_22605 [Paraburkholderia bryophila]
MELKYYIYCLADLALITTSLIYGVKLLKKRNYLLGGEWLVVTFSASNVMLNALTGEKLFFNIALFCDAFSRAVGVPVIAVVGMMAVTHRYKPSIGADIAYVVGGLAVTVVVWTADFMVAPKPYFYLVMWSLYSVYVAYIVKKLLNIGANLIAAGAMLALVSAQTIASIDDFYHIPGDDNHAVFYTLAMFVWAYQCVVFYYVYCALERAQKNELNLNRGSAFGGLERTPQ